MRAGKGKSRREIQPTYLPLFGYPYRYYANRHFWCRGYYVDTVGKNTAAIKAYIQNQIKEDLEYDQMSLVEYIDPFTGEPVKKNKK